ncbi:MAG TPA: peptidase M20, partial [Terrimesophilobacter sp.]|nr:peptidase M20 [Terrimesophilobacter sp.]
MTELSTAEQKVLDAIDETALVQELIDLIRVPSVTGTDAESDLQHRFRGQLDELGFEVDAWKLDLAELEAHPDFPGTEAPRVEGYGVVGQIGAAGTPALVLQAHVDVVPTGDLDKWVDRDP